MTPPLVLLVTQIPLKRRDLQLQVPAFQILFQVSPSLCMADLLFVLEFGTVFVEVSYK